MDVSVICLRSLQAFWVGEEHPGRAQGLRWVSPILVPPSPGNPKASVAWASSHLPVPMCCPNGHRQPSPAWQTQQAVFLFPNPTVGTPNSPSPLGTWGQVPCPSGQHDLIREMLWLQGPPRRPLRPAGRVGGSLSRGMRPVQPATVSHPHASPQDHHPLGGLLCHSYTRSQRCDPRTAPGAAALLSPLAPGCAQNPGCHGGISVTRIPGIWMGLFPSKGRGGAESYSGSSHSHSGGLPLPGSRSGLGPQPLTWGSPMRVVDPPGMLTQARDPVLGRWGRSLNSRGLAPGGGPPFRKWRPQPSPA